MGKIIFLYGVHGSGKTLLGEIFAEDEGYKYIKADAIEHSIDVTKLSPLERQLFFKSIAEASYSRAFGLAMRGETVLVDFGPYQIVPYTYWWVKDDEKASLIEKAIEYGYRTLRRLFPDVEVIHVFLLVPREDGYEEIVRRLLKRARANVSEEANIDYIRFVNERLRSIRDELERSGEITYEIDATKKYIDKYQELKRLLESK